MDKEGFEDLRLFKEADTGKGTGPAVVLCLVKNELDILPAFFDHYRRLGIREFLFLDNGSSDGTFEFLKDQADTTLYKTSGSYRESFDGICWQNHLADRHCCGRWTLIVDADEFLVLSGCEAGSLAGLIAKCESEIAFGVFCAMVDFYPESSKGRSSDATSLEELFVESPYCFPPANVVMTATQTYPYVELRSRSRAMVTGTKGFVPPLGKIPLVFWHAGYKLKRSTHEGSFLPLSNQTAILCHFKFRPGREAYALNELASDDRQSSIPVKAVLNAASKTSLLSALADAVHVTCIKDLEKTEWLSGGTGSFQAFWCANNKSRSEWFGHQALTDRLSDKLFAADLQASLSALMFSPSWLASKPIRQVLVKRGWLSIRHLPEVYPDPAGPVETIKFIVGSVWWDLALPVRLASRLKRKRRWRLLKGGS